ncbi:NAD(P)H-dependent oxidoreductase [Olivibacter sp. 47]|uniref:NADPH-dependent FMN reductase n=1 Tax=Olivibacter sp. 47 TaxID=3056486 RepID=UPI0025A4601D|nr:NAD(P)H-dependent oxidoreductase [Olivibacter sp. 47]MDM8174454.1 NAD(P)H-dependent oxidoreductase [Olivibacter sp. 47]
MAKIVLLSASIRQGRNSHRVALYFKNYIESNQLADVEMVDLDIYDFPLFEERLRFLKNPSEKILDFAAKIREAEGVLLVTPEYNGGYPASLKNVIDLLYDEWRKKPIALATASAGNFGGAQVMTSLVFSLWKIGSILVPAMFPVAKVQEAFNEQGEPLDKAQTDKRAHTFVSELLWFIEAKKECITKEAENINRLLQGKINFACYKQARFYCY